MNAHYTYDDLGYGVYLMKGDQDQDVFLQGDDAEQFLEDMAQLDSLWEAGNPNPSLFRTQEDHLDLLIDPYFGE